MSVFIDGVKHVWDIREEFLGMLIPCQKCPRTEVWMNPGKTTEIEPPKYDSSVEKLKWNSENNNWEIIKLPTQKEIEESEIKIRKEMIEKKEIHEHEVLSFLRKIRNSLLDTADVYIMKNYIDNNLPVPKEIKEYKQKLRNIPQKIESGELPMPKINKLKYFGLEKSSSVYETIDFVDWPVFPFNK